MLRYGVYEVIVSVIVYTLGTNSTAEIALEVLEKAKIADAG